MSENGRRFCENCGTEVRETTNFCPNCGAAQRFVSEEIPADSPPPNPENGGIIPGKALMIVAGVIVLLIIVATFDYDAADKAYNEARTGSSSPSPSPSPSPAAAKTEDGAVIQITGTPSKAPYSGSVGSASAGQHSVDGKLSDVPEGKSVKDYPVEIPVEANGNDVVTAVIQRQTDAPGGIVVKIVDSDGMTLKEGTTTASYGVVSISHNGRF